MRFQTMRVPYTHYGAMTDPILGSHGARAPLRRILWYAFSACFHNILDKGFVHPRCAPRARGIMHETRNTLGEKTFAPLRDRPAINPEFFSNCNILKTLRGK